MDIKREHDFNEDNNSNFDGYTFDGDETNTPNRLSLNNMINSANNMSNEYLSDDDLTEQKRNEIEDAIEMAFANSNEDNDNTDELVNNNLNNDNSIPIDFDTQNNLIDQNVQNIVEPQEVYSERVDNYDNNISSQDNYMSSNDNSNNVNISSEGMEQDINQAIVEATQSNNVDNNSVNLNNNIINQNSDSLNNVNMSSEGMEQSINQAIMEATQSNNVDNNSVNLNNNIINQNQDNSNNVNMSSEGMEQSINQAIMEATQSNNVDNNSVNLNNNIVNQNPDSLNNVNMSSEGMEQSINQAIVEATQSDGVVNNQDDTVMPQKVLLEGNQDFSQNYTPSTNNNQNVYQDPNDIVNNAIYYDVSTNCFIDANGNQYKNNYNYNYSNVNLVNENNLNPDNFNQYNNNYRVKIVKQKPGPLHVIVNVISYTIFILLLIVGLILLFYVLDSKIRQARGDTTPSKYNAYVVLSGSMEPKIHKYDVVVTQYVEPSKLKKNDIITFFSNSYSVNVTHRIMDIYYDDVKEAYTFRTKGDANNIDDPSLVSDNMIYGKVIFKIPMLGYIQNFLARQGGWIIVVLIPCLAVLSYDIMKLFKMTGNKVKRNLR